MSIDTGAYSDGGTTSLQESLFDLGACLIKGFLTPTETMEWVVVKTGVK